MNSEKAIHDHLAKKLEGGLFSYLYIKTSRPGFISVHQWFYTVLNGIVYECWGKELNLSDDLLIDVETTCTRVSEYDAKQTYKGYSVEMPYEEFLNRIKYKY